jgi:hypothetical protein
MIAMPPQKKRIPEKGKPQGRPPAALSDQALFDLVQRQTIGFFWDGAHAASGLALDRIQLSGEPTDGRLGIGGTGFGIMAIIVGVERGWIKREEAIARLSKIVGWLEKATCYHGLFPHFMDGRTGTTMPLGQKDDGSDIVESSYLFQGLLCARQYFDGDAPAEKSLHDHIGWMWRNAEWNWHTQGGRNVLTWHWSPNNGWSLDAEIRGWNECLITYIIAASSPTFPIEPVVYHKGWAQGRAFDNRRRYYDIELPIGPDFGGPLFFSQYSFCGLDPRGLKDRYADYWRQNVQHTLINYEHCIRNPHGHKGYGPSCWGLTASDDPAGYAAHAPDNDNGVISPTAALSSFPYAPEQAMRALRYFYEVLGEKIWDRYGFTDAFSESQDWYARTCLAIDQGPIVAMMENHRSGLLWKLFMKDPDVQTGLRRLGFESPHLT